MHEAAQWLGFAAFIILLFGGVAATRLARRLAVARNGKRILLPADGAWASWLLIGAVALSAVAALLASVPLFFPGW